MNINFYLTHPKRPTSNILMYVALKGRDYIVIDEKVETKLWDSDKQRIKPGKDSHNVRINNRLDDYERIATKHFDRLKDDGQRPVYSDIIEHLQAEINGQRVKKQDFFSFVESFIEQQKKIHNTNGKHDSIVTTYIQSKRVLQAYEINRGLKLSYKNMDLDFYADFIDYMTHVKKYSVLNAGKHIKQTRKFLRMAHKAQLHDFTHYEGFAKKDVEVDVIYLDPKEIDKIAKCDLSNTGLETQRDLFIIGCYTGLRYSDFGKLKKENFIDGFIHKKTQKMKTRVVIPIHKKILPILKKYDYQLPKVSTNQKINECLKSIGKKAKIQDLVEWNEYKLGETIVHISPKHDLITTHTARRSFATNTYKSGFPAQEIMKITGHKTEKEFFKYIRMSPMDSAQLLKKHWG